MKTLGSNIVCTPAEAPELTSGGLHIPESMRNEAKCRAFVVQTGPEVEGLEAGDEIIFTKASKFTFDDKTFIVVALEDILVVV